MNIGQIRYLYNSIDLRECSEAYRIGRGGQGVFYAEPYESELLPLWSFKDVGAAQDEGHLELKEQHRRRG